MTTATERHVVADGPHWTSAKDGPMTCSCGWAGMASAFQTHRTEAHARRPSGFAASDRIGPNEHSWKPEYPPVTRRQSQEEERVPSLPVGPVTWPPQPCVECGTEFTPTRGSVGRKPIYCSDACRSANALARKRAARGHPLHENFESTDQAASGDQVLPAATLAPAQRETEDPATNDAPAVVTQSSDQQVAGPRGWGGCAAGCRTYLEHLAHRQSEADSPESHAKVSVPIAEQFAEVVSESPDSLHVEPAEATPVVWDEEHRMPDEALRAALAAAADQRGWPPEDAEHTDLPEGVERAEAVSWDEGYAAGLTAAADVTPPAPSDDPTPETQVAVIQAVLRAELRVITARWEAALDEALALDNAQTYLQRRIEELVGA